jgi:hypothetical protein
LGCFSISALIPKGAFDVNHQKQFWSLLQSSFGLWIEIKKHRKITQSFLLSRKKGGGKKHGKI